MRFVSRLALLLLVAPGPVHGGLCSSTTVPLSPTTSTTLTAENALLQTWLDGIQRAMGTLPIRGPVVLAGTALARGRLKATIRASSFSYPDSALMAKGRVRIRRPGGFKLKLHPTRFGRRFAGGGDFFSVEINVRYRTAAGSQEFTTVIWCPCSCDLVITGGAGER
jgi:hypothetical protein